MTKLNAFQNSKIARALDVLLCMVLLVLALPQGASALEVQKCTARPNADSGNGVLGGIETRITWEGQAAEDEVLSQVTLTFPEGTEFDTDDARLTILTGDDLMTRETVDTTFERDGQTFSAVFNEDPAAGVYYRIEVYGVVFPVSGGDMQITGTYTLKTGETCEMTGIEPISVTEVTLTEGWATQLEQQQWVKDWNSNKFLRLFLNPPILIRSFPVVFKGFLMALGIVLCAFPLAIPFGLILSLMRMSKFRILRGLASLYVNIVRGTPLFLQIYIAFFGLPLAGVQISNFPLGLMVLAMNSSAYLCEIFRAGIQSIPNGQFEAARSLGMTGAQTLFSVIIPQTISRVLPTMTSEFILLYKDTSLLAAVGVMEVVMYAKTIVASTGSITPYIVAACFYLVITLPLAKLVGNLEAKLAGNSVGKKAKPKKAKKAKKKKNLPGATEEA